MTGDDQHRAHDGDAGAGHPVTLVWADGRERRLPVDPSESVVEAAEAAGVAVPYGCRYGVCATCTAELLEGSLVHTKPVRGLKEDAVAGGYVLPCIATPESACRLRVGHEIQADVVGTPWK